MYLTWCDLWPTVWWAEQSGKHIVLNSSTIYSAMLNPSSLSIRPSCRINQFHQCTSMSLEKEISVFRVCCMKRGWGGLPVFRPNIWKVSSSALWAAIGRAALLFAEAACPPVAGVAASHWPSGSHCLLKWFTMKIKIRVKRISHSAGLLPGHVHSLLRDLI